MASVVNSIEEIAAQITAVCAYTGCPQTWNHGPKSSPCAPRRHRFRKEEEKRLMTL
jgi:hypothetical protein